MSDPLYPILAAAARLAWAGIRKLAQTPTGRQVIVTGASAAAASATHAGVEKLRENGVDVSPGVEQFATGAAAVAGGMAGARFVNPPPQAPHPSATSTPAEMPGGSIPTDSVLPVYHYSGPPPTKQYRGNTTNPTNPHQGPDPMIPDVQIEPARPTPMPPKPEPIPMPSPPPPPPPPPIEYGKPSS